MKRNRQHVIEDESENILRTLIPSNWVLRKLNPDYGIDFDVEIFENEESTGLHFFIQLKGTDKRSKNGDIDFRIDKKYIDYFGKVSVPILFVYISVKSNIAWAKWLNSLTIDISNKSRLLKFTSNDILNTSKINSIHHHIDVKDSLIKVRFIGFSNHQHNLINKWISYLFKECIISDNDVITDEIMLEVNSSSETQISINIRDERFLINSDIQISEIVLNDYLRIPEIDDIPKSLCNFVFEFSNLLITRNNDNAINIALKVMPYLSISNIEVFMSSFISVVSKCIFNKHYNELQKLCLTTIDNNNLDYFQFIYMAMFQDPYNEKVNEIKETILLRAINKTVGESISGLFCYNLANHYANSGNGRKAILYYLKARKYEPEYLNRGYWYRELAGTLFNEKRYTLSAKLYQASLTDDRLNEPIYKALAADAYFMARKFDDSLKWFESYVSEIDTPEMEYILKKQILKSIKDEFGFKDSYSQTQAMGKYEEYLNRNNKISLDEILECLKFDPISPELRFEEGLILKKFGRYEEACISFLVSAVTSFYPAAWLNSYFMAVETKSHMMGIVLTVAFEKCGYALIETMRDSVLTKDEIPLEVKTKVIEDMRLKYSQYLSGNGSD